MDGGREEEDGIENVRVRVRRELGERESAKEEKEKREKKKGEGIQHLTLLFQPQVQASGFLGSG